MIAGNRAMIAEAEHYAVLHTTQSDAALYREEARK
jgi:hypothetical protein